MCLEYTATVIRYISFPISYPAAWYCNTDAALYVTHFNDIILVKVALHELLGHGTGKLFIEDEEGNYNFDKGKILNPLTNKPVESFYKVGEDYNSVFSHIKSAYEECRADSVAVFLCCWDEILEVLLPG